MARAREFLLDALANDLSGIGRVLLDPRLEPTLAAAISTRGGIAAACAAASITSPRLGPLRRCCRKSLRARSDTRGVGAGFSGRISDRCSNGRLAAESTLAPLALLAPSAWAAFALAAASVRRAVAYFRICSFGGHCKGNGDSGFQNSRKRRNEADLSECPADKAISPGFTVRPLCRSGHFPANGVR
jgi:hypothetical protein